VVYVRNACETYTDFVLTPPQIAYVVALGKYEGEGYWANYWYQSNSARRELLIEALMGRQNKDIREIKDAFRDKRYSDSLVRCMDKELKADKFRKAVLMALEGERQEESDVWPVEYRNRDVDTLYKAIKAREGGESAMVGVVLMRSDAHLREVLRTYERKYQASFARDALKKSNNLVVSLRCSAKTTKLIRTRVKSLHTFLTASSIGLPETLCSCITR
jgi:hypothetical protein